MASKRQRNRALKRKRRIDPGDLAPKIAAGLTQGASEKEALEAFPVVGKSGVEVLRHMSSETPSGTARVPIPHFHGKNSDTGFVRESAGRRMGDVELTFTPDVMRAIRAGMICLRCLEPQPHAFADSHIEGCEGVLIHGSRYMRDRQILDIAMEFEGEKHLGPSRPMQEFLDAQDVRSEKRQFIERLRKGDR